jgi:exopolysaccharide production protein ExoQ
MSTITIAGPEAHPDQRSMAVGSPPPAIVWLVFFLSMTAMLAGNARGSTGAYAFLALWMVLGGCYARASLRALTAFGGIWLFPGFALLSTVWSQAPGSTLRFSAEYAATVGCAILAAAQLTPRQLISALMCCLLLTAILSIAFGTNLVDPLTGVTTFVGLFESKNMLGFFVSVMLLGSLATMLDTRQPTMFRVLGLLALGVEAPLLVMTRSGTSELTGVLGSCVLIANLLVSRLSRFGRARLLFAGLVILLPSVAFLGATGDGVHDFIVHVMGKNTTLTGRTDLWRYAATLIPRHPLAGIGFQAFWNHENLEAEGLWRQYHVLSRMGFHFHSTYVEAAVELGYAGAALLTATLLAVLAGVVRWSWRTGSVAASFFVALMAIMLIRSFVEVDVMFQFQIGTFLLFVAAWYARRRPSEAAR